MKYILDTDDVFEFNSNDYITIARTVYKDNIYYFTNKLKSEEEPSNEFIVFRQVNASLAVEEDKDTNNEVLKVFSGIVGKMINTMRSGVEANE